MKTIAIALLVLFNMSYLLAQKPEEVVLSTKSGEIYGTLLLPTDISGKPPVVLIIAGSGPTDRNGNNPVMTNNSLKMLAEGLAANGIASLRYDKRGIGESKGAMINEQQLRFEHYIEDAIQWVAFLNKDARFGKVVVAGHSEGALIGSVVAQDKKADSYISIAGAGTTANQIIRKQLKEQPEQVSATALPILEKLENGQTIEEVNPMLYALFRTSVQPYLISWFRYNPQTEIAKLNKPVLIVQGTTDIQVEVTDARLLADANPMAIKKVFEGMNHILKEAPADRMQNFQTYRQPDLPLKEGLIEALVEFVNR